MHSFTQAIAPMQKAVDEALASLPPGMGAQLKVSSQLLIGDVLAKMRSKNEIESAAFLAVGMIVVLDLMAAIAAQVEDDAGAPPAGAH